MAGANLSLTRINLSRSSTSLVPSTYHRRTIIASVAQSVKLSYVDSIHSYIDSHLKKTITIRDPVSVSEPMHHLTFAPPKSTASALCVAACELVGGSREDAIVAASSIHLMHATIYSRERLLIGQVKNKSEPEPNSSHMFDSNIELLIGNGIISSGFGLLAESIDSAGNNSDKILRVIIEITHAIGAQGMINGQDYNTELDQLSGQRLQRLHECGAVCGAILGGGSEEEIERLKRFGVYVGKIQGLPSEKGRNEGVKMKLVESWRALALKELEYFDDEKIDQISTIVKN